MLQATEMPVGKHQANQLSSPTELEHCYQTKTHYKNETDTFNSVQFIHLPYEQQQSLVTYPTKFGQISSTAAKIRRQNYG